MIKQQRVKKRIVILPSPAQPSPPSILPFKLLKNDNSIHSNGTRTTPLKLSLQYNPSLNILSTDINTRKRESNDPSLQNDDKTHFSSYFNSKNKINNKDVINIDSIDNLRKQMGELVNKLKLKTRQQSLENQQKKMDELFMKLKLEKLDDWLSVSRQDIKKNGGNLLLLMYGGNIIQLLHTIYPHFAWQFPSLSSLKYLPQEHFQSIENQREFMHQLFIKYSLKTIDDWLSFSRHKVIQNGGKSLLNYYKGDFSLLLQCIYPNYPMEDIKSLSLKFKSHHYFRSIENQREFMQKLFTKFNLKSLDNWKKIQKSKFIQNNGFGLIKLYNNDMKYLLATLYPNYPWHFVDKRKKIENVKEKEQRILEQLFMILKLKRIDDWLSIPPRKIKYGGKSLLSNNETVIKFLQRVYPNFPWRFSLWKIHSSKLYFNSNANQRDFMDDLFIQFKLKSLDNWINIDRRKIKKNGGKRLLKYYKNDMKSLLSSIYSNYPWCFPSITNSLFPIIKEWIVKYYITQKKVWYRLPADLIGKFDLHKCELLNALKLFYPYEQWKKSNFILRNKKTTQRLLFSFTQKIYPSFLILEDYLHPHMVKSNLFELDIFIPALQIAMEYQGEHHYDDIPGGFAGIELFQERDVEKEKLASSLHIKIIYIPYWWDLSLSSLQTSLQSQL